MEEITIFGFTVSTWVAIPVCFFLWVTILLVIKKWAFRGIRKLTEGTKTKIDDVFITAADFPLNLLILTSGGAVVERIMPRFVANVELTTYFLIGFKATTIVAIILFVDKFVNGLIREYSDRVEVLHSSGGIAKGVIRLIVILLGVLILLDSFGVSVTPILASLGIGSLAVALALQPTLENFFAGMQILIDKPIKIGQFVRLDSGEEGYVHKIGWRSTWIRLLPNNVIVIPNKQLVTSKILNYYYPETEMSLLVQVGVHYDSDLEKVERIAIEVAKQTLKQVDGGVESFEPFIRYHTFADFSINFTVILRTTEFVNHYLIKHEYIKRLHKRFGEEGIVIPYPIRAINYDQEGATPPKQV